uniref:EthD domain-containing protein n=1 Tax=Bionectria ochroleuca TaxID=29856 RepID=A0A8H7N6V2_BIOOC
MASPNQLIKFQICIHKKDGIPQEDFVKWCTEDYPPRAIPLMKKHNMVKWTEVSSLSDIDAFNNIQPPTERLHFLLTKTIISPEAVEGLRHTLKNEMNRPKWTVPEYSIIMSYWLRSMDDLTALTTDPEWFELEKDAQKISNPEFGHIAIGHEITFIGEESKSEKEGTEA